jgi:hypothetical protein
MGGEGSRRSVENDGPIQPGGNGGVPEWGAARRAGKNDDPRISQFEI